MANKLRGEVEIQTTEGVRVLKYDMNAFERMLDTFGVDPDKLPGMLSLGLSITDLKKFVWLGLLHEDKPPTIQQVGKILRPALITEYAEAVGEAIALALDIPTDNTEPKN